jgi:hypothetical protein
MELFSWFLSSPENIVLIYLALSSHERTKMTDYGQELVKQYPQGGIIQRLALAGINKRK